MRTPPARRTPRHRAELNSAEPHRRTATNSSSPRHRADKERRTPLGLPVAALTNRPLSSAVALRRVTPAVAAALGVSVIVPVAGASQADPVDVTRTAPVAEVKEVSTPDTAAVPAMTALTSVLPPPVPQSPVYAAGEVLVDGVAMVRPATGSVTSRYGMRRHPITGNGKMHTGTDFGRGDGNVYAAADGVVQETSRSGGYGLMTVVAHTAADGSTVLTRYAHMAKFLVKPGDTVTKGQVIGHIGSTGMSTGPHLHFEVMVDGQLTTPPSH